MKSLDSLKLDINDKINNINDKLVTIKLGFKENLDDFVAESLSKIKDVIIEALHEENCLYTSSKDWKIGEPYFSIAKWLE